MRDYEGMVRGAKDYVTKLLCQQAANKPVDPMDMAAAIDSLNKAWDELTDALVRQRRERDHMIAELLNQLAERKER